MKRSTAIAGFTLIELMVAIFITAIVLSMGYGAVNQALRDREALDTYAFLLWQTGVPGYQPKAHA